MINKLLAGTAMAVVPMAAMAADLPVRTAAPAPVFVAAPPSWGGFYIGANFGIVWTDATGNYGEATEGGRVIDLGYHEYSKLGADQFGGLAGITAGYNFQSGNFVYGLEADIGGVFGSEKSSVVGDAALSVETSALATIRVRAGIASNNALFYLTAGAAAVRTKLTLADVEDSDKVGSSSKWNWAPVAGAGIEYNLGGGWSAKVEGLYIFESGNKTVLALDSDNDGKAWRGKSSNAVVRFGVNYRFGAAARTAPVVARY